MLGRKLNRVGGVEYQYGVFLFLGSGRGTIYVGRGEWNTKIQGGVTGGF